MGLPTDGIRRGSDRVQALVATAWEAYYQDRWDAFEVAMKRLKHASPYHSREILAEIDDINTSGEDAV